MPNISGNPRNHCQESTEYYYKDDGACNFKANIKEMLSVLQEKRHPDSNCIENLADLFSEPCLELDKEQRQYGVEDIIGLHTLGHNPDGKLCNL